MPGDPFLDGQFGAGSPRSTGDSIQDSLNRAAWTQGDAMRQWSEHTRQLGQQSHQIASSGYSGGGSGSGAGGLGAAILLMAIIVGGFWLFGTNGNRSKPAITVAKGTSYYVMPCQFTAVDGETHDLVDNELVRVQNVDSRTLEVSAYVRPYNGRWIRGTIDVSCIKAPFQARSR